MKPSRAAFSQIHTEKNHKNLCLPCKSVVPKLLEKVPAILEGFYLGEKTGTAAADVLFSDYNPGINAVRRFPVWSVNCRFITITNQPPGAAICSR